MFLRYLIRLILLKMILMRTSFFNFFDCPFEHANRPNAEPILTGILHKTKYHKLTGYF